MKILNQIKNSVYNPEYYRELLSQPASYSVKYLFKLSLIFALLFVIGISAFFLPKMISMINSVGPGIINNYPNELEISVKEGNVSTNVQEPYFIKTPDSWKNGEKKEKTPENLVVIDTKSEPSADNLKKYATLLLVTKNYVIYHDNNGKITAETLEKMPNMIINKDSVTQFSKKYSPYLNLFIPFIILILFVFSFFIVAFRMIYLLIVALFIWLIARIKKVDIGYGKSYQLGIHLMTAPLLTVSLFSISFPLSFTTLLLILAAVNINRKKETEMLSKKEEQLEIKL